MRRYAVQRQRIRGERTTSTTCWLKLSAIADLAASFASSSAERRCMLRPSWPDRSARARCSAIDDLWGRNIELIPIGEGRASAFRSCCVSLPEVGFGTAAQGADDRFRMPPKCCLAAFLRSRVASSPWPTHSTAMTGAWMARPGARSSHDAPQKARKNMRLQSMTFATLA